MLPQVDPVTGFLALAVGVGLAALESSRGKRPDKSKGDDIDWEIVDKYGYDFEEC